MSGPWNTNRFAGLSSHHSHLKQLWHDSEPIEFVVLGLPCSLFDDSSAAQFIEDGSHLQAWEGDESATMDRFDCRLLLDSLNQLKPRSANRSIAEEDERLADELWVERFSDFELAMQKDAVDDEGKIEQRIYLTQAHFMIHLDTRWRHGLSLFIPQSHDLLFAGHTTADAHFSKTALILSGAR